jgi:hypothetical protein
VPRTVFTEPLTRTVPAGSFGARQIAADVTFKAPNRPGHRHLYALDFTIRSSGTVTDVHPQRTEDRTVLRLVVRPVPPVLGSPIASVE